MKKFSHSTNISSLLTLLTLVTYHWMQSPTVGASTSRQSFGQNCNENEEATEKLRCDRRAGLRCGPLNSCICTRPDEMVYVQSLGRCVTRAGEQCRFLVQQQQQQSNEEEPISKSNSPVFDLVDCAPSATCDSSGFCSCEKNHFENSDGTCSPKKSFGESCSVPAECSLSMGLTCGSSGTSSQQQQCQCVEILDGESPENCVGQGGQPCVNERCTANSYCTPHGTETACVCYPGFYQTDDGKCKQQVGLFEQCNKTAECQSNAALICNDGVCSCDPKRAVLGLVPLLQNPSARYNENSLKNISQCVGLAGFPCVNQQCTEHADCKGYQPRVCECKGRGSAYEDYRASKFGTCKMIGSGCKLNDDCLDGLVCSDGVCKCPFHAQVLVYNSPSNYFCRSKLGGPCEKHEECGSDGHAECRGTGTIKNGDGQTEIEGGLCVCKKGYVRSEKDTRDDKCDWAFGQSCKSGFNLQCDTMAGLACVNDTCQCADGKIFNSKFRRCEGIVGSPCDVWRENNCLTGQARTPGEKFRQWKYCSENMVCTTKFPGHCFQYNSETGRGHCQCLDGFVQTKDYTCEREKAEETIETIIQIQESSNFLIQGMGGAVNF